MNTKFLTLCFFIGLLSVSNVAKAQFGNIKAMQVDFFGTSILHVNADGNADYEREDRLLQYAQSRGFNYLVLYDMQSVFSVSTDQTSAVPRENEIHDFIYKAKTQYGIQFIGVSSGAIAGSLNKIFRNVDRYNARQSNDPNYCFDVLHLEYEYWLPQTGGADPYYQYTGEYTNQVNDNWDLKTNTTNHPLLSEIYVARLWQIDDLTATYHLSPSDQADFIDDHCDRVVLALYFNGNWIQPTASSAFFEKDAFWGKRFELFANSSAPHNKHSHIIPYFSAEQSDLVDNKFFGDYLHLVDNGFSWNSGANKYDDNYFNTTLSENKAFLEFQTSYVRTDPYNVISNGTTFGNPCNDATKSIATCTGYDNALRPYGNSIDGVMWFKYGLLPGSKFYTFGDDFHDPINVQFTITPDERMTTNVTSENSADCINTLSLIPAGKPPVQIASHLWYRWESDGISTYKMFEPISAATNATYQNFPLAVGSVDKYLHQIVTTPVIIPYYFNYKIRNEIDVTGDPPEDVYFLVEIFRSGFLLS